MTPRREPPGPKEALAAALGDLERVLMRLTQRQYIAPPPHPFASGVGPHVRHCLDHLSTLLEAAASGEADYDSRQRGTPVESSREAARRRLGRLRARLRRLRAEALDRPVRVRVILNAGGDRAEVSSTLGREMAFVMSHTIHHGALIAAILRLQGHRVPEDLGVAPSTLAAPPTQATPAALARSA